MLIIHYKEEKKEAYETRLLDILHKSYTIEQILKLGKSPTFTPDTATHDFSEFLTIAEGIQIKLLTPNGVHITGIPTNWTTLSITTLNRIGTEYTSEEIPDQHWPNEAELLTSLNSQ